MKLLLPVLMAVMLAFGCAGGPPTPAADAVSPEVPDRASPRSVALKNAEFEVPLATGRGCPEGWNCSAHSTASAFGYGVEALNPFRGGQSVVIDRRVDEPWGLMVQVVDVSLLRGMRIRFGLAVRHEGAGGGIGPIVKVQDGAGVVIGHAQDVSQGSSEWRRISVELEVPRRAMVLEVGALREGAGRSWVDDAVLEVLGPGSR